MSQSIALTPEGEALWLRLSSHLQSCDHFALGFIFSAHPLVVETFRARLSELHRVRITGLESFRPRSIEELKTEFLERLLHPQEHLRAIPSPLWIDLSRDLGAEWREARAFFLARLNERRELLRRAWRRPVVLIFPTDEHDLVRRVAPDLWAIRTFTFFTPATATHSPGGAEEFEFDLAPAPALPLSPGDRSAIQEWERVVLLPERDRGFLAAGERALRIQLRVGGLAAAAAIARELYSCSRQLLDAHGASETTLRDHLISAAFVGDVCRTRGEVESARSSYFEALDISRQILELGSETAVALRLRSMCLERVGDTEVAAGDFGKAAQAFAENAAVCRQIYSISKAAPDAQRALAVAIGKQGHLSWLRGDYAEAEARSKESLRIFQDLLKAQGESTELLRDMAIALSRVGDVQAAVGRLDEAKQNYSEALDLHLLLQKRADEIPETLRDIAIAATRLGIVHHLLGEDEAASARYRQSVGLAVRLVERFGDSTAGQSLLARSRQRLGEHLIQTGNLTAGIHLLNEALTTVENLCRQEPRNGYEESWRKVLQLRLEQLRADPLHKED